MRLPWAAVGLGAGLGLWLLLGGRKLALPLLVVGDSIAVGVGQALVGLAPARSVSVEAQSGEGVGETAAHMEDRLGRAPMARTVVLSTGVNSLSSEPGSAARVMDRTVEIVDAIRATGRKVILVGPPPANGMPEASVAWQTELAGLERLHGRMSSRVSLWALLGDDRHPGYFDERYGTPGGLHPNRAGYERVAAAILWRSAG